MHNSDAALLQLVAQRDNSVPRNYAINVVTFQMQKTSGKFEAEILRFGDVVKIQYLKITVNEDMTTDEFKRLMKKSHVSIMLGGIECQRYIGGLMVELNAETKIGNTFLVVIPSNITLPEINLLSMPFNLVVVKLTILDDSSWIRDVDLYVEYSFLVMKERRHMATSADSVLCQQINSCGQNRLFAETQVKGFFMEGDLSKIQRFKLKLNGKDRINMDQFMLQMYCHKISDNLHYLSYTNLNNYKEVTWDSFSGSADHGRFELVEMELVSDDAEEPVQLHMLQMNRLQYKSGSVGMMDNYYSSLML